MTVIVLSACPVGLRGDLTRWFLEIAPGVFVGHVSARVRERVWIRVKAFCEVGPSDYGVSRCERATFGL